MDDSLNSLSHQLRFRWIGPVSFPNFYEWSGKPLCTISSPRTQNQSFTSAFSLDVAAIAVITSLPRIANTQNTIILFLLAGTVGCGNDDSLLWQRLLRSSNFLWPDDTVDGSSLFFVEKCKQSNIFFCVHFVCFASSAIFLLSIKATIFPLSSITSQITISLPNGRTNDRTRGALQLSFLLRASYVYCYARTRTVVCFALYLLCAAGLVILLLFDGSRCRSSSRRLS